MTLVMSSEVETSRCRTVSGATRFLDYASLRSE
jgi:hypothetical protein